MSRLSLYIERLLLAGLPVAALVACSSEKVVGGISEETNTVAGILVDASGNAAAGVPVMARHLEIDSVAVSDTTDSDGRFGFSLEVRGRYGVFAQGDSEAFFDLIDYQGEPLDISAKLEQAGLVAGTVHFSPDSVAAGVKVSVPGAGIEALTDEDGEFRLDGVPMGALPVLVKSPDEARFADALYFVDAEDFFGPVPAGAYGRDESLPKVKHNDLLLPVSLEYGLQSWWTMDSFADFEGYAKKIGDVRDWTDGILVYGVDSLEMGAFENALALYGANQFGIVVNDKGLLDGAKSLTLEAWINIASTKAESYRMNIIGMFSDDSSEKDNVFSLALMDGECGAHGPSLAFFTGKGEGDSMSCGDAAIAEFDQFDEWVYVTVVWDGKISVLYVNGEEVAEKHTSVKQIVSSSAPIKFGGDSISLKLDEVRLSTVAITAADVLFRYKLQGGAK